MAIQLQALQNKMKQAAASINLAEVEKTTRGLSKNMEAMARVAEKLPEKLGADTLVTSLEEIAKNPNVVDNIQAITNTLKDFPKLEDGVKPVMSLKNATSALQNLQSIAPELQRPIHELAENGRLDIKIKIPINQFPNELKAITEGPIISGFNDIVVGLGTAAGIAASLKQTSAHLRGALAEGDITGILQTIGSADVQKVLGQVSGLLDLDVKDILSESIGAGFDQLEKNLAGALKTITESPLLDLAHDLNKTLNIIGEDIGIPAALSKEVLNVLKSGGVSAAISLVGTRGKLPLAELEAKLGELESTVTTLKQIVRNPIDIPGVPASLDLSSIKEEWKRGVFRYVKASGEVRGELLSCTRDIDKIVVHWSETYLDQDIGASELNSINNNGIPYHYVIKRDGSVQRGRNVNEVGAHTESSYDTTSIGIVLVGGYPTYLGDDEVGLSGESLTQEQMTSLEKLMGAIYEVYPGADAYGHGELGGAASEIEPGFSVKDFALSKFNKTSDPIDTTTAPPRIEDTSVPRQTSNTGSKGRVVESYRQNPASIRDDPIQPDLKNILESVAFETNTTIYITSGGQLPNDPVGVPGGRTGGPRHNYGWAADIVVKDADGKWLDFGIDRPSTKVLQFYNSLVRNGITGVGAGKGYMYSKGQGVHAMHVDIAAGRSTTAPRGGRWGQDRTSKTAALYIK